MPLLNALALAVFITVPAAPPLPRGNDDFQLGMLRAQVDSAVAARRLPVLSGGSAHLVCGSDDPAVEYEQYSFFTVPHGMTLLWKVTVGYRLATSPQALDGVRGALALRLGEPASDNGNGVAPTSVSGAPLPPTARQVIWVDPFTAVQLAARWGREDELKADRMIVTWTDRRLQRLIEARRKQGKRGGGE